MKTRLGQAELSMTAAGLAFQAAHPVAILDNLHVKFSSEPSQAAFKSLAE